MDASFWVAAAFVCFIALLAYLGVFKSAIAGIDARSDKIRKDLAEAESLRDEARRILSETQAKVKAAESDARAIVDQARKEAEAFAASARKDLQEFMARRRAMAEDRIAQAEAQAIADVKSAAADAAVKASEIVLAKELRGAKGEALISERLQSVKANLN
jgi:F-type H+-transporting ATPase subunit b